MTLTGAQLGALGAIVLKAITNEDDLAKIVSERMEIRLAVWVKAAGLETMVFRFLSRLETEGRTDEFIHALIEERPHLKEQLEVFLAKEETSPRSFQPRLHYRRSTEIDPECISALLNSREPPGISYFKTLAEAVGKLRARDEAPEEFFRQYPGIEKMNGQQRAERASSEHARNGEILRQTGKAARTNETALHNLLQCLTELDAPPPLAARSLETFAGLAALYIIRELKRGFDWVEGRAQPWFESFKFARDGAGGLLDCVPNQSATGRLVFGYRCWVMARAGHPHNYEGIMFPLKFALPLFRNGEKGHAEAFFTWVLPQLILNGFSVKAFPVEDWEALCLWGAGATEWWGRHQESPWPDIVNMIHSIEL